MKIFIIYCLLFIHVNMCIFIRGFRVSVRVSGIHGFDFGAKFSPKSVFGSSSGFDFGFRFLMHGDSTWSEPDPLPSLVYHHKRCLKLIHHPLELRNGTLCTRTLYSIWRLTDGLKLKFVRLWNSALINYIPSRLNWAHKACGILWGVVKCSYLGVCMDHTWGISRYPGT
jgi:hypothetical protein